MKRKGLLVLTTLLVALALTVSTAALTEGNLPGGTSLSVDVTSPTDGLLVAYPPGNLTLEGTAAIGEGEPLANSLIVYVIDVSYSAIRGDGGTGCGGDMNGDGVYDTVLDCEIMAAVTLNELAVDEGTVGEVGVAVYGGKAVGDAADTGGAVADVGPAAGAQLVTEPAADADGSLEVDVVEVLTSAYSEDTTGFPAGVELFTLVDVGSNGTNFAAGLQAAVDIVAASTMDNKMIVFMSDGIANTGVAVGGVSVPEDVVINTFAVGSVASCSKDDYGLGSLDDIAAMGAGGVCKHVKEPADLPGVIPEVVASELYGLDLSVNGGAAIDISGDVTPTLPLEGPASVSFAHALSDYEPGEYELCVTATGSDAGGEGMVTDCTTAIVAGIVLEPETAVNELGTPGQTHTVTATVAAGEDGGVESVIVTFEIESGPNTGGYAQAPTDEFGQATFTYEAMQGIPGLGTDVIEACFTDDLGIVVCDTAEKEWVDTTPPDVSCVEGTNPSGKNTPRSKNSDGFWKLLAEDAVDPDPMIYVVDTGSGEVFGPFESGTQIKYTQAPGVTPKAKKIGSEDGAPFVDWHILGKGDPCVYAIDYSGNIAECVECLVPPPPK
ncbi:MAG: VWA domain-containing protein [Anaerolineae bacterium]|nr:VWA domain-containing protein [Anaerolineae bacterium]